MVIERRQRSPLGALYRTPLQAWGSGVAVPPALELSVEMRNQDNGFFLPPSEDPCFIGFGETGGPSDFVLQYRLVVNASGGDRPPTHQEFRDEFAARNWVGVRTLLPLNMGGTFYCEGPRFGDVNQVYNPGVQSTRSQFSTGTNYPLGADNYIDFRQGTGALGYENGELFYDAADPPSIIRTGNVDSLNGVQSDLTWTPPTSSPCSLGTASLGGPGWRLNLNLSLEIPGFVNPGPPDFTLFETYFEGVTVRGQTSGAELVLGGTFFCEVGGGQFRVYQPPLDAAGDACQWRPGTGPGDFYTQREASGTVPAFQNGENLIFL